MYKPVDGGVIEGLLGGASINKNENLGCLGKSPVLGTGLSFHVVPVLSLTTVLSGMYLLTEVSWVAQGHIASRLTKQDLLRSVSGRVVLLRNQLWKRILTFETVKKLKAWFLTWLDMMTCGCVCIHGS